MIEVYRLVEPQSKLYAQQATTTSDEASYLESALEITKPKRPFSQWHDLIASQFRYPPPVPVEHAARFRPPFYFRNVLYASAEVRTILYEHAYHFLLERVHAKGMKRDSGLRTIFSLFVVSREIMDIRNHPSIHSLMARNEWSASHAFTASHPEMRVLLYPSCRDPKNGDNYAVFDIKCLGTEIGDQATVPFSFDPSTQVIHWLSMGLSISWQEVS